MDTEGYDRPRKATIIVFESPNLLVQTTEFLPSDWLLTKICDGPPARLPSSAGYVPLAHRLSTQRLGLAR